MRDAEVDSVAFRRALLLSERRRIYGITAFFVVFAVAILARIVIYRAHVSPWGAVVLLVAAAYELWVLRVITRALEAGKDDVPAWLLPSNILMEIAVPALGAAYFSSPQIAVEYRPIANPWVLGFFPLLLLSVLRLRPRVSQIAGVTAAIVYMASAYHLGWRPSVEHLDQNRAAHSDVVIYAAILFATGFIAGMVSGEIREYVEAALREAETERQLKQVEHDLEIARSIQQSLLPTIRPTVNGLEISGWNLPADATGGDYFDWRKLRDGRVVVTLADVTGHGIGPALLASVCRAYARSSFDTHDDVVTALQRVNQYFGEDLTTGRFATFVAAVCSEDGSRVELLSAGQGPLFVYSSARDSFEELAAQAIPLGLLPELNASAPAVLKMEPGDMVVLATDGFFEWENADEEQFGVARLTEAVRAARHLEPEEIIQELYNAVKAFANGTKQMDDLTAVVIKRVADGDRPVSPVE
jgi:serine phosphatase RsbU (regulator of sigma subunit)